MAVFRPNVILVVAHDLGTMLGCCGAEPLLRTPHLDQLAAEGVRFSRHFSCAPFCSPSRGGLVTGQVPHVNGLMGLVNLGWDLPAGTVSIGHHMRKAGYHTALFGLQHEAMDDRRLGFDELQTSGPRAAGPVLARAVQWLAGAASRRRPFYLQIGFADVHRPYPERPGGEGEWGRVRALPYLADSAGLRQDLWDFYGLIEDMDRGIGVLLQALREQGLEGETLMVFTTDHGIAFPRAKGTLHGAGLHTALIMRGPGPFRGGRECPALLSNVDLLPTLLEAVGSGPVAGLQGHSFLPLLEGRPYRARAFVFAELNTVSWNVARCIRTPTHNYIHTANPGPLWHLPTDIERGKTRRDMGPAPLWQRPETEFYDLRNDPLEQHNLAGAPAVAEEEALCRRTLTGYRQDTHDPLLDGPIARPATEARLVAAALSRVPGLTAPPR
ncbi:MAG: sulfatase [Lentisphaeria bacterium]|nr:sulfatase [Lentisphaeria bacterium]